MTKKHTPIWNNFQIISPTFLDGHFEPDQYSIVKWQDHEPYEVVDLETGEKRISTRNCFVIGTLIWDHKEPCFEFSSCGLRYFENRIDGLEGWIMEFCKKKEEEYLKERYDYEDYED